METQIIKVSHTALPDGKIITYDHGMPKPEVKNIGELAKRSIYQLFKNGKRIK